MKICRHCKASLPFSEFSPLKSGRDGLNPWCKGCRRTKAAADRAADPERFLEIERKSARANADKKRARSRDWYLRNRDAKLRTEAIRYLAKRDVILAQKANYRANNLDKIYVLNGARRAAERRAMPSYADRSEIAALYRLARETTKATGVVHHVDHVYPLIHPEFCGLHVHWNMQVMTGAANMAKGNRRP